MRVRVRFRVRVRVRVSVKVRLSASALLRGEPEQPPRLCKVLRHIIAGVVHVAKLGLRFGVALRCSEPKPPRLLVVTRRVHIGFAFSWRNLEGKNLSLFRLFFAVS
jgi:hypothetical protein